MRTTSLLFLLGQALCLAAPVLRLEPDSASLSLGHGSVGEVSYVVRNAGDEPLHVGPLYTTCDCSRARLSRNTLAPGETALLTLIYDTRFRPLPGKVAHHQTEVRLYSNASPEGSCAVASLEVEITNAYRFLPFAGFLFHGIRPGEAVTGEVIVFREGRVTILSARASEPWWTVRLEETEVEGRTAFRVVLVLDGDAPAGDLGGSVVLGTDLAEQPEIVLPVVARRVAALRCRNDLVRLVPGDTVRIPFYRTGAEPPRLLECEAPDWLAVTCLPREIVLCVSGPLERIVGGELVLLFADGERPLVTIPVLGLPRAHARARQRLAELGLTALPDNAEVSLPRVVIEDHPPLRELTLRGCAVTTMGLLDADGFRADAFLGSFSSTCVVGYAPTSPPGFRATACEVVVGDLRLLFPVFGARAPTVEAVPGALYFNGKEQTRTLYLRGPGALEAVFDCEGLEVVVDEPRCAGRRLVLRSREHVWNGTARVGGMQVPVRSRAP